jgi:L-lysine 2,3-aminomutase
MSDDLIKRLREIRWRADLMHEAADRIEELLEERERVIKASNDMFCVMSDSLNTAHAKLTKAVEALQAADLYIHDLETHEGAEGFSVSTAEASKIYHAALAELEGEPLGAEFEAVWDANKAELYQS